MTRLLLLATVLLLSACDLRPPRGTETGTQNLLRFHDDELSVTCWQVKNWDGIYCIPDSRLKHREQAGLGQPKSRYPRGTQEILSQYAGQDVAAQHQGRIRL